ncbi:SDR family oxidoreductase [Streptomyces sp. RM72]|uniref:SDR family oxidoreductase n=1 Tax=Streptomyces sp. RM72 TaxID=1115510 RepID=UPI001B395439|nr:SDR family oxidoreductase [Streptomyces sp. RM72]MBQ0891439.1 SDR family oxidoreductase [Streptomyces sp. RM72]
MGKTVLITGASTGIGRAAVIEYAARGWNVVATMRDTGSADPAFAGLDNVFVNQLDVTDSHSVDWAVKTALERFDAVDAVLNNAGYAQLGAVEEITPDQVRDQFETNVVGVVRVIRAVLPHMRRRGSGHIINVGSMGGHVSLPTMAVYCASKSALQNLTEGLARELAHLGIDVTLVEPAGYDTHFSSNSHEPANPTDAYAPAYDAMRAFSARSVKGNLTPSIVAIADITCSAEPPLHLAVNSFGLTMVRERFATLMGEYARWEHVTARTD